jgi:prepilin-type N-terminal cleavage/methylation domain-containing protein
MNHFFTTKRTDSQAGFTIVELMIASVVFSTILVVITVGIIRFTNGYYRGINSSSTQATAQNAIDSITQAVQFSSSKADPGDTNATDGFFCAGGKVFTYSKGQQFNGTPADNDRGLFMMDRGDTCADPTTAEFTTALAAKTGVELLNKGMRVVQASVTAPDGKLLSNVHLMIAYGDPDLLCSPAAGAGTGGCNTGAPAYAAAARITAPDTRCKTTVGSQFCTVVDLSSVAQQRLVVN